ncbi:MAG: energy-coupling factor ABC transporter ATP-binding protein [Negativicutes bacterium]
MPAIRVEDLTFRYRRNEPAVFEKISLTVEEGECIAILGDAKSTLCMAMCGVIPHLIPGHMEGRVEVFGNDTREMTVRDIATHVGVVLQDPENQLFNLTVEGDIVFAMENLSVPREEMEDRLVEALTTVRMLPYRYRPSHQLSGGQKQRAAIAAVLAMRPRLMILDEPTRELDPLGKDEIFEVLGRLKQSGITIVVVENDPPRLATIADRMILLRDCGIAVVGEPRSFFRNIHGDQRIKLPQITQSFLDTATPSALLSGQIPLTVEEGANIYEPIFCRHQG